MNKEENLAKTGSVAIVDRIDGLTAVLDIEGAEVRIPRAWLPKNAREGDVLHVEAARDDDEARLSFVRDDGATQRAREEAQALLRRLGG